MGNDNTSAIIVNYGGSLGHSDDKMIMGLLPQLMS